jgi:hypothetical protein
VQVGRLLKDHSFLDRYVFNIDETRSEPRDQSEERFVCPKKEGRVPFIPFSDLRTTVNIISASGKCWLTIYLYKDDNTADPDRAGTIPVYHVEVLLLLLLKKTIMFALENIY